MSTDINAGYWMLPADQTPDKLIAVDTERVEPQTGRKVRELLVYSCGWWYTVGLKRRIGPRGAITRWRPII